jgi:hypothetical protein
VATAADFRLGKVDVGSAERTANLEHRWESKT